MIAEELALQSLHRDSIRRRDNTETNVSTTLGMVEPVVIFLQGVLIMTKCANVAGVSDQQHLRC